MRECSRSLEKCLGRRKDALEVEYRGPSVEVEGSGRPETWDEE